MQKQIPTLGLFFVLTNACTQNPSSDIGVFATATSNYTIEAISALNRVNKTSTDRRITDIATIDNSAEVRRFLAAEPFSPVLGGEAYATRVTLLLQIKQYADGLQTLSNTNFKSGIDDAASKLGGSVEGLGKTLSSIPGNEELGMIKGGPITAIVSAAGNKLAEAKRVDAIKKVVIEADPLIQKSMSLLASNDWPALNDLVDANLKGIYSRDANAYTEEYQSLGYDKRVARLQEVSKRYNEIQDSQTAANNLVNGARAVASAHSAIATAVNNNVFSTEDIAQKVAELAGVVGSLAATSH